MYIRFAGLFFFLFPLCLKGQSDGGGNIITPGQLWNEIVLTQGFNKIVTQLDIQSSSSSDLKGDHHIGKYLINYGGRAWCHYFFNPRLKFSGSIGYWISPDVPSLKQKEETEFRPAIQIQHFRIFNRFTFYNKFRFESRFLHQTASDINSVVHRLRYIPKLFISINGKTIRAKTCYLIISDDLFFNINQGEFLDQNRIIGGLGYCFTDNITLELTYVNKFVNKPDNPNEFTNALSLSFSINNISGLFKGD